MNPSAARFEATMRHIDSLLHARDYSELERLSKGRRLSADLIRSAIEEYPEELSIRPEYKMDHFDIVSIRDRAPVEWSVYLDLWRKAGGRSDLTVELTLIESDGELYSFEIDNIRVQ
jgi:hypothetical protein